MFISLQTTENWVLEDSIHPAIFFSNLGIVLSDLDTLVIGSYEMDADSQDYFLNNTFEEKLFTKPYFDSFDSNRDEYSKKSNLIKQECPAARTAPHEAICSAFTQGKKSNPRPRRPGDLHGASLVCSKRQEEQNTPDVGFWFQQPE